MNPTATSFTMNSSSTPSSHSQPPVEDTPTKEDLQKQIQALKKELEYRDEDIENLKFDIRGYREECAMLGNQFASIRQFLRDAFGIYW